MSPISATTKLAVLADLVGLEANALFFNRNRVNESVLSDG